MFNDASKSDSNKFKKTLEEIRDLCNSVESVENVKSLYDAAQSGMYLQARIILKKINECGVLNDRS